MLSWISLQLPKGLQKTPSSKNYEIIKAVLAIPFEAN